MKHLGLFYDCFMRRLFSFPNPVNEIAARVVAGFVLVGAVLTLATGWYWLLIPIAYGFWARVLTGPTDHAAADAVLALLVPAAALESLAGYCLGCKVFGLLMRAGWVPETVCAECADIGPRLAAARD